MRIHCIGINHNSAPIQLRERLAYGEEQIRAAFSRFACGHHSSAITEMVILSTCNRTEVYAVSSQEIFSELEIFLSETRGVKRDEFLPHLQRYTDMDSADHLFHVAALDLIRGEEVWRKLEQAAGRLEAGIASAAKRAGVPIQQTRVGTMFTTFFSETKPVDWNAVKVADKVRFGKFFQKMLEYGVYLTTSQFEAGFISIMHTDNVVDATIAAAEEALRSW